MYVRMQSVTFSERGSLDFHYHCSFYWADFMIQWLYIRKIYILIIIVLFFVRASSRSSQLLLKLFQQGICLLQYPHFLPHRFRSSQGMKQDNPYIRLAFLLISTHTLEVDTGLIWWPQARNRLAKVCRLVVKQLTPELQPKLQPPPLTLTSLTAYLTTYLLWCKQTSYSPPPLLPSSPLQHLQHPSKNRTTQKPVNRTLQSTLFI